MKVTVLSSLAICLDSVFATAILNALPKLSVTKVTPEWNETLYDTLLSERQSGCTFQAFSGSTCSGNGGAVDPIGGSPRCILTANRHSFFLSSGCPTTSVILYSQSTGCSGSSISTSEGPGCYNVNDGQNWQSSSVTA